MFVIGIPTLITMKYTICGFLTLFLFAASSSAAQEFTYSLGIKGGLNYSLGGYGHEVFGTNPRTIGEQFDAQSEFGFHGGVFAQANLGRLFLRPEITYSSIKTSYDFPLASTEHEVTKIDIPVLLGYNIIGPVDIYAGPVYSNIRTSEITVDPNGETGRVVVQGTPGVNLQAGLKFDLGRFELDFRYERTLTAAGELPTTHTFDPVTPIEDGTTNFYGVNDIELADPRIHQIILSVSFKIFGNDFESNNRRSRGDWCY